MHLCGFAGDKISRKAAKLHKENKSLMQFRQQLINICAKPFRSRLRFINTKFVVFGAFNFAFAPAIARR